MKEKKNYCVYACTVNTKLKSNKDFRVFRVKAYLEGTNPKAFSLLDVERGAVATISKALRSKIEKAELIEYSFWGWTDNPEYQYQLL